MTDGPRSERRLLSEQEWLQQQRAPRDKMSTALLPRAHGYLLMSMSSVGSDPSMDLATVSVSLSPPSSSVASEKSAERGSAGGERARGGTAGGPSGPHISSAVLVASTRLDSMMMMIAHKSSAPSLSSSSRREGTFGEQQPRALSAPGCWSRARPSCVLMEGPGPVGSIGMRTGLMKGRSRMVPSCEGRPGSEVGEAIRCASVAIGGGARRGEARRWRSGRDRHKGNGRKTAGTS